MPKIVAKAKEIRIARHRSEARAQRNYSADYFSLRARECCGCAHVRCLLKTPVVVALVSSTFSTS